MNKKDIEVTGTAESVEVTEQAIPKSDQDAVTEKRTILKKKPVAKEKVIYVGPTIVGVVVQSTVFSNGIPSALKAVMDETPSIGSLLVPISKLPPALKEISSKKGAMHIFFENAKQYKPKKGV